MTEEEMQVWWGRLSAAHSRADYIDLRREIERLPPSEERDTLIETLVQQEVNLLGTVR